MVDEKGVQEDLKQAEQEEQLRAPAEEAPAETPVEGGEEAPEETTREEEGGREETEAEAAPCCPELEEKIRAQQEEIESLTNRLARLQADFDNYRKRTRKEMEDLIRFGSERVITNLLPVVDNFERALQAAGNNPDLSAFVTGVEMIYRQLMDILTKEGVAVIPTANQPFNPEKHHAVAQVETSEMEDNMIVEELQKGYTLHGKVIRPSMVRVAKKVEAN